MLDERFLMHRLKSTSLAAVVGGISMGAWVLYEHFFNNVFHWDIFIIMWIMAVTKLGAVIYYKKLN